MMKGVCVMKMKGAVWCSEVRGVGWWCFNVDVW